MNGMFAGSVTGRNDNRTGRNTGNVVKWIYLLSGISEISNLSLVPLGVRSVSASTAGKVGRAKTCQSAVHQATAGPPYSVTEKDSLTAGKITMDAPEDSGSAGELVFSIVPVCEAEPIPQESPDTSASGSLKGAEGEEAPVAGSSAFSANTLLASAPASPGVLQVRLPAEPLPSGEIAQPTSTTGDGNNKCAPAFKASEAPLERGLTTSSLAPEAALLAAEEVNSSGEPAPGGTVAAGLPDDTTTGTLAASAEPRPRPPPEADTAPTTSTEVGHDACGPDTASSVPRLGSHQSGTAEGRRLTEAVDRENPWSANVSLARAGVEPPQSNIQLLETLRASAADVTRPQSGSDATHPQSGTPIPKPSAEGAVRPQSSNPLEALRSSIPSSAADTSRPQSSQRGGSRAGVIYLCVSPAFAEVACVYINLTYCFC